MAYSKQTWQDLPNTTTPITASRLNHMEDGIEANDVNGIVVSATEPSTDRRKVWLQKGKNLFDISVNSLSVGLWSSGNVIAANSSGYYVVCPIEGGKTYTISKKNTTGGIYCASTATYPKDGTTKVDAWQGASDVNSLVYQTSSNAKYLFIGLFGGSPTDAQKAQCIEELMVEQGSTATTYEAYIKPEMYAKNTNNVYESVDLRKEEICLLGEQKIGTWINGKTLYKKTVARAVSANTNVNVPLSDFGINNTYDVIIDMGNSGANYYTSSSVFGFSPICYYISDTDRAHVYINANRELVIQNQNNFGRDYYITLKYTKTTD